LVIWRRPDQFHHPYVWVEEGTITLPAYLELGWSSLWAPVAGYLVVPAKLIFLTAASLSFTHLPRIEYWLTLLFTVGTLALVAFSPSKLRYPKLAAVVIAMLPTDSEVFGVSEYAFWWGAIWSFVAVFWDEESRPRTAWRCVLAAVGGLSSPMAIPVAIILAYRLAVTRRASDIFVGITAGIVAVIQYVVMKQQGALADPHELAFLPAQLITRFFGNFAVWSPPPDIVLPLIVGIGIVALGVAYTFMRRKWFDPYFIMLIGCLVASVLASVSRVSPEISDPILAGPRYFFFPYIFLGWLLLYVLADGLPWQKALVVVAFFGSTYQYALHGQRFHDRFAWRAELAKCSGFADKPYEFPVHFNGDAKLAWHVPLTGLQCDELRRRSLFH